MKTAAILLSRQALRPSGITPWVRAAVAAVRWVAQRKLALYTSIGSPTWEFLAGAAVIEGVPQILVVPSRSTGEFNTLRDYAWSQFGLTTHDTATMLPAGADDALTKQGFQRARDNFIINNARTILPVSIRRGGTLEEIMLGRDPVSFVTDFHIHYNRRPEPLHYSIDEQKLSPEILSLDNRYIIHWTRTSNSPWPGETLRDYYGAIINSASYPRSAFLTLQRILATRRLIGSSRHMPGKLATVSFTGLDPKSFVALMKWRARYREMSFEPYGIGIERAWALVNGIKPVGYAGKNKVPDEDRWLSQSRGAVSDWQREDEYRCLGNFDLSRVPREKLAAFCLHNEEARLIGERSGVRCFSFLVD